MYFATGATHAPHHVPKEYIAKYKGKFDGGWDKRREETLARQIELGVVPKGTKLTRRPEEIAAWDSLSADQKRLFARQMETFAAFAEHTDHEVGRLVEAIRDMGELDNTLIFYIVGDNGASAEGGPDGTYNEMLALNGIISDSRRSYPTSTSGAALQPSRISPSAGPLPATPPSSGPSRSPRTSAARAIRWSSTGRRA